MKHTTTLKKISQILDISISTVSRALKNHPDISEKTKKKVLELATALEYEPNTNAINLRTNNNRSFGLIVPNVSHYFYDTFISSVEEECRKYNYSLIILQSWDDPETEVNNIKICRQNRVTGVFLCISPSTIDVNPFLKLEELDIPLIFFDKVPDFDLCNKVCHADKHAAEITADLIISKQRKKVIAFFGNIQMSITKKRLDAFTHAFASATTQLITDFALSYEEAYEKTLSWLSFTDRADTIFCMSDEILTGVMKALQKLGLKVPHDIAVIAISNGIIPKMYYPEITYAETSGYKLGKLAFARMMECLSGNAAVQESCIESLLVEGGSI